MREMQESVGERETGMAVTEPGATVREVAPVHGRVVHDTMGELVIPEAALWGAQTQRSLMNFPISHETMPAEIIRALLEIKASAAVVNARTGKLDEMRSKAVVAACEDLVRSGDMGPFPLKVWQTGSGTQSNMNVNEVVAELASRALQRQASALEGQAAADGQAATSQVAADGQAAADRQVTGDRQEATDPIPTDVHPNDHVNMSQSSNDVFPAAIHIAAIRLLTTRVLPEATLLRDAFVRLEKDCAGLVKIGRTHLQDAVPVGVDQEISGWRALLEQSVGELDRSLEMLGELPLGGTAAGTGLNTTKGYDEAVCEELCQRTGFGVGSLRPAPNKFASMGGKQALLVAHSALKGLACALFKIANDIRLLASGPRCGLGEWILPANEPGSSIMPGKVNPTQCEAVCMAALQVMGNDTAVTMAAASGHLQLNTYMPLIAYDLVQSSTLMADCCSSFRLRCVDGMVPNKERLVAYVGSSLMLVTRLAPVIGYECCAQIVKEADKKGLPLREAAVGGGYIDPKSYDELMVLDDMLRPADQ